MKYSFEKHETNIYRAFVMYSGQLGSLTVIIIKLFDHRMLRLANQN